MDNKSVILYLDNVLEELSVHCWGISMDLLRVARSGNRKDILSAKMKGIWMDCVREKMMALTLDKN